MDSVGMSLKWVIRPGKRVEFEALPADICLCLPRYSPLQGTLLSLANVPHFCRMLALCYLTCKQGNSQYPNVCIW